MQKKLFSALLIIYHLVEQVVTFEQLKRKIIVALSHHEAGNSDFPVSNVVYNTKDKSTTYLRINLYIVCRIDG